jgi:hypothetical protein
MGLSKKFALQERNAKRLRERAIERPILKQWRSSLGPNNLKVLIQIIYYAGNVTIGSIL